MKDTPGNDQMKRAAPEKQTDNNMRAVDALIHVAPLRLMMPGTHAVRHQF